MWNLLNTILKVKIRTIVWVQNSCQHIGWWPFWSHSWLGAAGYYDYPVSLVSNLGKDLKSKFKLLFLLNAYHFHTIEKLKNHKSSHHKPRKMCILKLFCFVPSHNETYGKTWISLLLHYMFILDFDWENVVLLRTILSWV